MYELKILGNIDNYDEVIVHAKACGFSQTRFENEYVSYDGVYSDQFLQWEIVSNVSVELQYKWSMMGFNGKCDVRTISLNYIKRD